MQNSKFKIQDELNPDRGIKPLSGFLQDKQEQQEQQELQDITKSSYYPKILKIPKSPNFSFSITLITPIRPIGPTLPIQSKTALHIKRRAVYYLLPKGVVVSD